MARQVLCGQSGDIGGPDAVLAPIALVARDLHRTDVVGERASPACAESRAGHAGTTEELIEGDARDLEAHGLRAHGLKGRLYADLHTGGIVGHNLVHDFSHDFSRDLHLHVLGDDAHGRRTPVELEIRPRDAHGCDRRLGDRDNLAIGDEQCGAAEIDAGPDGRDGVKLLDGPTEQRRLIAPAVPDEAPKPTSRDHPTRLRAVRRRLGGVDNGACGLAGAQHAQEIGLHRLELGDEISRRQRVQYQPVAVEDNVDASGVGRGQNLEDRGAHMRPFGRTPLPAPK